KERPRFSVFRSNKFIYAQLVDDVKGHTFAEAHADSAKVVGLELAKKAKVLKITKVVFDRGGYLYTGKIKKLADSARKGGLVF
ncbi:MAG TPA: 50S ribosomal protein L18, partial [Candidatus Paceibacterota bacterium]